MHRRRNIRITTLGVALAVSMALRIPRTAVYYVARRHRLNDVISMLKRRPCYNAVQRSLWLENGSTLHLVALDQGGRSLDSIRGYVFEHVFIDLRELEAEEVRAVMARNRSLAGGPISATWNVYAPGEYSQSVSWPEPVRPKTGLIPDSQAMGELMEKARLDGEELLGIVAEQVLVLKEAATPSSVFPFLHHVKEWRYGLATLNLKVYWIGGEVEQVQEIKKSVGDMFAYPVRKDSISWRRRSEEGDDA